MTNSPGGNKTVNAFYNGTPGWNAAYSGSLVVVATQTITPPVTVVRHPTSIQLSCSPTSVAVNHATTCTARVTDTYSGPHTVPTGTVTFGS